jgi:flagellar hook protein FlgE
VSGVKAHQTYLDVTGNNIANVNTTGFKRDVIQFADMISQTIRSESAPDGGVPIGGVNPAQVGLGVKIASISTVHLQGSLQATGIPTDMAIQGEGYFIVNNRQQRLYTRAGNFSLDKDGNLVMSGNGFFVQGYKFSGASSREAALSDITIPIGETMPAKATALAAFRCNLDSRASARVADAGNIPTGADKLMRPYDYSGAGDFFASSGSAASQASVTAFGASMMGSYDWKDSSTVYDSQGKEHTMVITYRKAVDRPADPGASPPVDAETEWDWYAYYVDSDGNVVPQYGQGAGTMVFGSDGLLKRTYTCEPTQGWGYVERPIGGASASSVPTGRVEANFGGGESAITLDFLGSDYAGSLGLPFGGAIEGVTSFGSGYTTKMRVQDGYPSGALTNWSVSGNGIITGTYANGQTRPIAQVALAMFSNPQGLEKVGGTCFAETVNSGAARVVAPGEDGAGSIEETTLEMSNVDLSEEFVNLIRSQRGLQANTKAITTSDQILEELINLKR